MNGQCNGSASGTQLSHRVFSLSVGCATWRSTNAFKRAPTSIIFIPPFHEEQNISLFMQSSAGGRPLAALLSLVFAMPGIIQS